MRPFRARWWRPVVGALLAVVLLGGLAACVGSASARTGDCVQRSGELSYMPVDCAGTRLRVLERIDRTDADCAAVPGVTESFTDYDADFSLCIGPRDADPAAAVNVADVGDCISGIDPKSGTAGDDVRRVDCADPAATVQVLSRRVNVLPLGFECQDVPGSTATYSWSLDETSSTGVTSPDIGTDVQFCLGPAGVDPQSSPDAAQAGDCLRESGDDPGYAKVDCGAPDARYRVVTRVENGMLPIEIACRSAPGAVSGVSRTGLEGYTLCLAPK